MTTTTEEEKSWNEQLWDDLSPTTETLKPVTEATTTKPEIVTEEFEFYTEEPEVVEPEIRYVPGPKGPKGDQGAIILFLVLIESLKKILSYFLGSKFIYVKMQLFFQACV